MLYIINGLLRSKQLLLSACDVSCLSVYIKALECLHIFRIYGLSSPREFVRRLSL